MATDAERLSLLSGGEFTVNGRLVDSSNSALVVTFDPAGDDLTAVYKPLAGERSLWDFPQGRLAHREVAAYALSQYLGWDLVPTTVWRERGPAGPGMCQLWIDTQDPAQVIAIVAVEQVPIGWHLVVEGTDGAGRPVALAHSDTPALRRLAVFDVLCNNADRKAGHILMHEGRILGIDHGLTFHHEPKLRTVLWGFADDELSSSITADLRAMVADWSTLAEKLSQHLTPTEVFATQRRAEALLAAGRFPSPAADRPAVPWPLV